ncbi:UDP-N-acetylglucosamine 1-carboxyvinyltransferase [Candidatus Pelagibacter sp. RS39]|uniref:UDP-N-acetylglucosamine 1-carboxyvinyltransferase n=1 Tax=Candidatus Pelagibacter sp. RS39 TaxID=1977864 RepID=UPI000A14C831|nr:UDP-N-acetylglucosamine 1-carboxyvinyltransferase [Candidatus Pelagibacter sp. RS39]ARJ47422.1 UDP-N-acetylglucosamine 1-carboxyvinyltransferase [Candidatus Pelagibacter sp. RS39]
MDKFSIEGPSRIRGEVEISGSKNSSLPILAATLLFNKPVVIKNLPRVKDINTMINLLRSLGSKIILSKDRRIAKIHNKTKLKTFASYSLVKTMRGSILVLGPLISKYYKSKISLPGGCLIGARPINYHLDSLKKLGMSYVLKDGYIIAKSKGKLKGTTIKFPKLTVGATENSIIAACLAKGTTILKNCAIEPEIKDLTNFLNSAGAKISWIGRTCKIVGINTLNPTEYSVMADRIEAGTFCVAATLAKGNLKISNFDPKIINTEMGLLKKFGAKIKVHKEKIFIKGPEKIRFIKKIKTKEYPGVATDLQSQIMVLMCKANGKGSITENIFENRFMHVAELRRLGAKIDVKNNQAHIYGNTKFIGAELMSSDLRASVSLVLAAMVSKGKSIINRIYHLDRGYENIEHKLKKIGVKIKRIKQ